MRQTARFRLVAISNVAAAREKSKHHLVNWCIDTNRIQPEAKHYNHVNILGLYIQVKECVRTCQRNIPTCSYDNMHVLIRKYLYIYIHVISIYFFKCFRNI